MTRHREQHNQAMLACVANGAGQHRDYLLKKMELVHKSLNQFSLKWRWTDTNYCLMPSDDLCQIFPLNSSSAQHLWNESLNYLSNSDDASPNQKLFKNIESIDTTDRNIATNWLMQKIVNAEIVVSWQPDIAVATNADIFLRYWDEFCYPASDDVSIWPRDKSWVLHYWHEEMFFFGVAK